MRQSEFLKFKLQLSYLFSVPWHGLGVGLALFWTEDIDLKIVSHSKHHIDTVITNGNDLLRFTLRHLWPSQAGGKETHLDPVA